MAKPDKAESTSTVAESKSSGATSSTNKATHIDTSSKPDGYKSLSDVDKAYIVNNRDKNPEAYNNLKKDLDTLSYLTNPVDVISSLMGKQFNTDDRTFKSAFNDFTKSKKDGIFNEVKTDQVLKDYVQGVERKTYKAPEIVEAPKVPTTVQAPKREPITSTKREPITSTKSEPITSTKREPITSTKSEPTTINTESTVSRNRYDPLSVDFSGLKSGAYNVFGEMSRGHNNLGGNVINREPTDIITKRLPKSDSIESSDNSSYNINNPSSGGYTNDSVSSAADKQYRRVSRNNESIGLSDDPNRANYNDDWNRGMTDKSTDVVSDENKKTFIKKIIKRDPLNRTITKKIISKKGM